jgi:hypothetical protein
MTADLVNRTYFTSVCKNSQLPEQKTRDAEIFTAYRNSIKTSQFFGKNKIHFYEMMSLALILNSCLKQEWAIMENQFGRLRKHFRSLGATRIPALLKVPKNIFTYQAHFSNHHMNWRVGNL